MKQIDFGFGFCFCFCFRFLYLLGRKLIKGTFDDDLGLLGSSLMARYPCEALLSGWFFGLEGLSFSAHERTHGFNSRGSGVLVELTGGSKLLDFYGKWELQILGFLGGCSGCLVSLSFPWLASSFSLVWI